MLRLFLSCVVFVALGYRPAQAGGTTTVALAPITQIGGTGNKGLNALETRIEKGIAALPGISLLRADNVQRTTRKAKRPELRTCDGDASCLAALGKLVGADLVVYGEVSDLGSSQVVYLKAIETVSGKELRSTTLELGSDLGKSTKKRVSKAAAAQLLAPNLHVGTLKIESSVPGATVFLDGHAITTTPDKPIRIYVGSHALRVTHPEHSDYVRFVDVRFEEETLVKAELMDLPGLSQKLSATGVLHNAADNTTIQYRERPWYYQWYTITGGVAILAITSAVLASGDSSISPDLVRDL